MVFLWLLLVILFVGISVFFKVKRSKVKQEELQQVETDEGLPKFKL